MTLTIHLEFGNDAIESYAYTEEVLAYAKKPWLTRWIAPSQLGRSAPKAGDSGKTRISAVRRAVASRSLRW